MLLKPGYTISVLISFGLLFVQTASATSPLKQEKIVVTPEILDAPSKLNKNSEFTKKIHPGSPTSVKSSGSNDPADRAENSLYAKRRPAVPALPIKSRVSKPVLPSTSPTPAPFSSVARPPTQEKKAQQTPKFLQVKNRKAPSKKTALPTPAPASIKANSTIQKKNARLSSGVTRNPNIAKKGKPEIKIIKKPGMFMMPGKNLVPAATYSGDFNGDGHLDRLVFWRKPDGGPAYANIQPTIFLARKDGSFRASSLIADKQAHRAMPAYVRVTDFNGDARDDILIGSGGAEGERLLLLLSHADGKLHDVTAESLPDHAPWQSPAWLLWDIALGDIDADGDMDILLGTHRHIVEYLGQPTTARLFVNDGEGLFYDATDALPQRLRDPQIMSSGTIQLAQISLEDINKDGADDLSVFIPVFGKRVVFLNAGFGDFTNADPLPATDFINHNAILTATSSSRKSSLPGVGG